MKLNFTLVIVVTILSIPITGISLDSVYSDADLPTEISVQGNLIDYELEKDLKKDKQNTEGNSTDHVSKFFAIQHAQSGSIVQIFDKIAYSLKLNDVSDKTILFSDRPDRIVKSVSTSDFIGNWSIGEDSFAKDAPNAVLVIDGQEQQNVAIVELFDPIYNSNTNMLEYNIHSVISYNKTAIELPSEFGKSTFIIDSTDADGVDYNYISDSE